MGHPSNVLLIWGTPIKTAIDIVSIAEECKGMDLNILSAIQCFARVSPKKSEWAQRKEILLFHFFFCLGHFVTLCNIETVLIIAEELPGRAAIYIDLNTLSTRVNPKKKIHVFLIFFCRRQPPFQIHTFTTFTKKLRWIAIIIWILISCQQRSERKERKS